MRSLLILIISLLLAVLALPYGAGMLAERSYRAQWQSLAEQPELTLTQLDYQRGWFTSTAQVQAQLHGAPAAVLAQREPVLAGAVPLRLRQQIRHGPLFRTGGRWQFGAAGLDTDLDVPPALADRLTPYFADGVMARMAGHIGLDGSLHQTLQIPAYAGHPPSVSPDAAGGGLLRWAPLRVDWTHERGGESRMALRWPALSWHGEDGAVLGWQGLALDLRITEAVDVRASGLRRLDGELTFERLVQAPAGQVPVTVHGLRLQPVAQLDDLNRLAGELRLAFERLAQGEHEGSAGGSLQLRFANLPPATLQALGREAVQREPELGALLNGIGELQRLLAAQPVLELVSLEVETPAGRMTGRGRIAFRGEATGFALLNPARLFAGLDAQLQGQVPADLATSLTPAAEARLTDLLAAGYVRREGQTLHLQAALEDGWLLAHGQPRGQLIELAARQLGLPPDLF